MFLRTAVLILSMLMTDIVTCRAQAPTSSSIVAGWIERINLPDHAMVFEAKLDTGADNSSVNGRNIERFRREGLSYIRFALFDDSGKFVPIEAPVVRTVKVKRSGLDGDSRPVIRLKVCVGGLIFESDFTVADRADLSYQVLIGRNVLAGRILVDSGRERIVSDKCR